MIIIILNYLIFLKYLLMIFFFFIYFRHHYQKLLYFKIYIFYIIFIIFFIIIFSIILDKNLLNCIIRIIKLLIQTNEFDFTFYFNKFHQCNKFILIFFSYFLFLKLFIILLVRNCLKIFYIFSIIRLMLTYLDFYQIKSYYFIYR